MAGGQGGPGPGPLPAPGQSVPSIPAPWDRPILGTPIAEGSKSPKVGLGARLQAGTDPCQGRAGGHGERHHALSVEAGTCAEHHCPFPLKRGKRWSFTPSSPSGPGGSLLARTGSARPLPPPPGPPAPGSPWSWRGHIQARGKAQGLGRGHLTAGHQPGAAAQGCSDAFCKVGGGTRPGSCTGKVGAQLRAGERVLACLQTSPRQAPVDKHPCIPPALLPAEKLQDVRSPGSRRCGRQEPHPASRQLSSFPPSPRSSGARAGKLPAGL